MSLYLLDTDTLSLLQARHPLVVAAVTAARRANDVLGLTIITVEEQVDGWLKAHRQAKTPQQLARASRHFAEAVGLWGTFLIAAQTESSLAQFERLVRLKLNVKKNDLRIASVALDLGSTLVTHNAVDFRRVPDLSFVDWAATPSPL